MGDPHTCDSEAEQTAATGEHFSDSEPHPSHPKTDVNGNKVTDGDCSSASGEPTGVRPTSIEVARRFLVRNDCEVALRDGGGKLLSEKSFQDDYFDTENYDLTVRGYSLRRRNGSWQLKHPPVLHQDSTQPCKVQEEADILQMLAGFLDITPEDPDLAIDDLPAPCKLQRISSFRTWRKCYEVEGVMVDLDLTDFGFSIGKMQSTVEDRSKVCSAITRIDDLGARLGFRPCADCDLASLVTAVDAGMTRAEESCGP